MNFNGIFICGIIFILCEQRIQQFHHIHFSIFFFIPFLSLVCCCIIASQYIFFSVVFTFSHNLLLLYAYLNTSFFSNLFSFSFSSILFIHSVCYSIQSINNSIIKEFKMLNACGAYFYQVQKKKTHTKNKMSRDVLTVIIE